VRPGWLLATAALAGCRACEEPKEEGAPRDAATVTVSSKDEPHVVAPASTPTSAHGPAPTFELARVDAGASRDGGADACKRTFGPIELAYVGAPALYAEGPDVFVVFNARGMPRTVRLPIQNPNVPSVAGRVGTNFPPCALARGRAYCVSIERVHSASIFDPSESKVVVDTRASGPVAAVAVGEHTAIAWLEERMTTEGKRYVAMVKAEGGDALALSDEGSGATFVAAVPAAGVAAVPAEHGVGDRRARAILLTMDARTSMVPVHARPLEWTDKGLVLGTDRVVHVGGAPEPGVRVAGVRPLNMAGAALALLPISEDVSTFGLRAIRLDDPLRDDEPVTFLPYPNGLDPAPMATARDGWVAFVRPADRAPAAPQGIELGQFDAHGRFASKAWIDPKERVTDLALALDAAGAVWLAYATPTATRLERRTCP
jgi:hypothetical protein